MRKLIIFFCMLVLLLLSACKDNKEQTLVEQSDEEKSEIERSDEKQITADHSGKKKLVWLVYDQLLHDNGVDENIYIAFNNLLVEKGADYIVEFIGFDPMDTERYQKNLLDMKGKGEQIDLFMSGFGNEEIDTNIESVKNDLLEPLDQYLQTEQGKKLYAQFDEKVWERIKIDQKIYGLNNNSELYYPTTIYINEEIAESIGVEIPEEIHQLAELEEWLKKANIKDNEEIVPFYYDDIDLRGLTGYDFLENGLAANYNADGIPYVFNPFEDAEVTVLLKTFERLAKEGYWQNDDEAIDKAHSRQFLSYVSTVEPLSYVDGILYHFDKPIKAKSYPLNDAFVISLKNNLTGIASWSENKEEAFDLLTRINTDADLSNLLYYGIEENHYKLEDGAVKYLKDLAQMPGYYSPANRLLTHREKHEPKDKEKVMRDWLATAKKSPIMGFELDSTEIEEELTKIQAIYDRYYDLWLVQGIDVDAQLKEVNQKLAEAGIDRVLDEINGQLLKWWEAK